MGSLFDAETTPQHTFGNLNRGVEIPRNDSVEYGIHYHSLAYRQVGRSMDPFLIEYTPAKPRGFLFHESEEFFVLLEGTLEFFLYDKDESHVMHAGETLYLKPNVPHRVALARSCTPLSFAARLSAGKLEESISLFAVTRCLPARRALRA